MNYQDNTYNYREKINNRCNLHGFSPQTIRTYSFHIFDFLRYCDKCRLNLSNQSVKSYLLSFDNMAVSSMRLKYASISFFFRGSGETLKQSKKESTSYQHYKQSI